MQTIKELKTAKSQEKSQGKRRSRSKKAERAAKELRRKKIIFGSVIASILVLMIIGTASFLVFINNHNNSTVTDSKNSQSSTENIETAEKSEENVEKSEEKPEESSEKPEEAVAETSNSSSTRSTTTQIIVTEETISGEAVDENTPSGADYNLNDKIAVRYYSGQICKVSEATACDSTKAYAVKIGDSLYVYNIGTDGSENVTVRPIIAMNSSWQFSYDGSTYTFENPQGLQSTTLSWPICSELGLYCGAW